MNITNEDFRIRIVFKIRFYRIYKLVTDLGTCPALSFGFSFGKLST